MDSCKPHSCGKLTGRVCINANTTVTVSQNRQEPGEDVLWAVGVDTLLDVVGERDVLPERLLVALSSLVPAELGARLPDPGPSCGEVEEHGQLNGHRQSV